MTSTQILAAVVPALHGSTTSDLVFWTQTDLVEWIDAALKRMAQRSGVFVARSTGTNTVVNQRAYSLPARHLRTLHVAVGVAPLRAASQAELEALDAAYQATAGPPTYWYEDQVGDRTMGLYPVPDAPAAMTRVDEEYPPAVNVDNTEIPAPLPLRGYLAMAVLAEAYGREGEMESQDIAEHCRQQVALYDRVLAAYYGGRL